MEYYVNLANINARQLTNGAVFVQYQQDGKAKDAAFMTWADFVDWLRTQIVATGPEHV